MEITTYVTQGGKRAESVEWGGYTWRRYPDGPNGIKTYFRRFRRENGVFTTYWLHKEVWKSYYGDISSGYVIHHIDGNAANNCIANLELLTASDHAKIHEPTSYAHQRAAEWHRSQQGREWHSEHAAAIYAQRVPTTKTCEHCGKEFQTRDTKRSTRFCSDKCRSLARYKRGDDNETRLCPQCLQEFTCNRYSRKKCCSRKCGGLYGRKNK